MNRLSFLLAAALVSLLTSLSEAAPNKDHDVLRTLQSLKEKSLHKRLMNLSAMGPQAYKQLQAISFNRAYSPETRAEAFRTAVTLGKDKSEPEIHRAAEHKDWFMRALALEAYGHIEPAKARTMARQWLLNDSALMVRAAALGRLHEEPITEELKKVLLAALEDPKNFHRGQSLWIRGRIAESLLRLDPNSHTSLYKALLQDTDRSVRQRAISKLQQAYPSEKPTEAAGWLALMSKKDEKEKW